MPKGNWFHYWTSKRLEGNTYHEVSAAPGFLPMFIQEGKVIPTFNKEVDSFVENVQDPNIKDFEYVNSSIEILFYGYCDDTLTLWDGTVIHCWRSQGEKGSYEIKNGQNRTYSCLFID